MRELKLLRVKEITMKKKKLHETEWENGEGVYHVTIRVDNINECSLHVTMISDGGISDCRITACQSNLLFHRVCCFFTFKQKVRKRMVIISKFVCASRRMV